MIYCGPKTDTRNVFSLSALPLRDYLMFLCLISKAELRKMTITKPLLFSKIPICISKNSVRQENKSQLNFNRLVLIV